ncbi:helix-turn-helix domain-containing protein [Undibacterium sp. FT147W]|uniref:Helix-turn-helix domain-containing protein n=1 Tax=Undibacterium rivi TaxID=2828729 RepID=A0ABS5H746_9BURK|nr:helix-turn-helix transcriptional regulator [Undibacterium rivi]MBR7794264.1 helix-turn-helix domain-containing protein [Undibacterium rivi]
MSDAGSGQPLLSEVTGSFHYQELIESRLGQPIATDVFNADAERLSSSPGARLAAARNASGWTVDQVATQLKITRHQILAIEADDYNALPAPAIVRGFVRAYAKLLKLDSAPLLELMPDVHGKKKMPTAKGSKARASTESAKRSSTNAGMAPPTTALFIYALCVVGLVLAVVMYK